MHVACCRRSNSTWSHNESFALDMLLLAVRANTSTIFVDCNTEELLLGVCYCNVCSFTPMAATSNILICAG